MRRRRGEYVSLQDRAHQREQARLERNQRLGLAPAPPRRTVVITDEQMARMDREWLQYYTNSTPIYASGNDTRWRWVGQLGTAATNATVALNTMSANITTAAMNNFGSAWVSYNPSMYTTTFTTSANDQAYWAGWNTQYVETEEARIAREAVAAERQAEYTQRMAEAAERDRVAMAERAAAEVTARELLNAHLDAQQKRDMLEHGWFEVTSNTGRRWRIRTNNYAGNIDLMPAEGGNVRLASYCAHSPEYLPLSDHHLIQKIVLEADEAAFLAVANLNHYDPDLYHNQPELIPDRRRVQREQARVMRDADIARRVRRDAGPVVIGDVAPNWGAA